MFILIISGGEKMQCSPPDIFIEMNINFLYGKVHELLLVHCTKELYNDFSIYIKNVLSRRPI